MLIMHENRNCKIIKFDQIASIRYEIFISSILTGKLELDQMR